MTFLHEEADLGDLLTIVGEAVGIDRALVEKDYWVTHTLWALERTDLGIWFKGGTSLSKGFGLIERFSEDLDLFIEPGKASVPPVRSWTSMNRGPIRGRRAFFEALAEAIEVPQARVLLEAESIDRRARGARYRVEYPGLYLAGLGPEIRPFVLLEVGAARVTPHISRVLSSFVHDWLDRHQPQFFEEGNGIMTDNRPRVRCVHPLVTLIEKLDAISRRFPRDPMEPAAFIRHYEDAARIITRRHELPPLGIEVEALIEDMLGAKQIRHGPTAEDPGWLLREGSPEKEALQQVHQSISPMFWGERFSLGECCEIIRSWLS